MYEVVYYLRTHTPADVFLPDGLLADRAVQEAVEGLEEVVVCVRLGEHHRN